MNNNSGFTLIEVLLALSIIGMAMLAAVQTSEATTRNLRYIQERTLAQWVAQNAWVSIQTNIDGLQPVAGRWQSTMELADRSWLWQAYSNPTIDPNILQITLEVREKENQDPIVTLITYRSTLENTMRR
ncbi:MAG: type II secretion system minor pseudopilin GspI [Gammaproteobacteria bacterium]